MSDDERPVLLFDGVCNLCNAVTRFVIRRDPGGRFVFAALQSTAGQALLERHRLPKHDMDSFVLIHGGRPYIKSRAALETVRLLGWPWKAAYPLVIVPRPIRDAGYDLIAKTRYRIFGKRDACMMPTPEIKARFLA